MQLPSIVLERWKKQVKVLEPQVLWEGPYRAGTQASEERMFAWLTQVYSNLEEGHHGMGIQSHGCIGWLGVQGWGSDKAGFGNVGKELENELTATDRVKTTFVVMLTGRTANRRKMVSSPFFQAPFSTCPWQSLARYTLVPAALICGVLDLKSQRVGFGDERWQLKTT